MAQAEGTHSNVNLLPIKIILPEQGRERKVQAGGSKITPFRPVNTEYRSHLSLQVSQTRRYLFNDNSSSYPSVARVKLITKAIAKTHRPTHLFSEDTCPIIGAGSIGELFIRVTPDSLVALEELIISDDTKQIEKELSGVETIDPITPEYRLQQVSTNEILDQCPVKHSLHLAKVQLFHLGYPEIQDDFISKFVADCEAHGIILDHSGYSDSSLIFAAKCHSESDIAFLSMLHPVRSVRPMPIVANAPPPKESDQDFHSLPAKDVTVSNVPVVVVVDSGISTSNPNLAPWIVGHRSHVAMNYRNPSHGTFVAGLICHGDKLNPGLSNIDTNQCAVFDLQVIPNADPNYGDTDYLNEQELLIALEAALEDYSNDYKVWNLSLGTNTPCSLDDFSTIAQELDNLQEMYKVSFVISAGNFNSNPMLSFPRTKSEKAVGRICQPADSVLGITVGSISHIDYAPDTPRLNELAPYSRNGAGPNHIIKPDLVHYGGTCTRRISTINGITSLAENGTSENLGTSFAAPLVSKTLARIYHDLTPEPSPVLARALLTHHARDPRTKQRVPDGDESYFGFGVPAPTPYCLQCTPSSMTFVFDDVLRPGYYLEWDNFPYPTSLTQSGRYFGNIWMTIAFSPSRGSGWGSEYCETHIDAHFGVYYNQTSRKDNSIKTKFKGLVPLEHNNRGLLYESYQIEKLRKWAPVRTYFGDLGLRGTRGNRWRLKVQLLTRHRNVSSPRMQPPQPFSLILTITDPAGKAPVYDEMAQIIYNRFATQNLTIRSEARIRGDSSSQ